MVYLHDDLTEQTRREIEQQLKVDRAVGALTFVSKEQALADFQTQFPAESHLLQGLGQNPFPASFVVTLAAESRSSDAMRRWANRAQLIPGVVKVQYNQEWVEALAGIVRYIEVAAIIVGLILSAASVTIIANTIRLALYSRREEIEILWFDRSEHHVYPCALSAGRSGARFARQRPLAGDSESRVRVVPA